MENTKLLGIIDMDKQPQQTHSNFLVVNYWWFVKIWMKRGNLNNAVEYTSYRLISC